MYQGGALAGRIECWGGYCRALYKRSSATPCSFSLPSPLPRRRVGRLLELFLERFICRLERYLERYFPTLFVLRRAVEVVRRLLLCGVVDGETEGRRARGAWRVAHALPTWLVLLPASVDQMLSIAVCSWAFSSKSGGLQSSFSGWGRGGRGPRPVKLAWGSTSRREEGAKNGANGCILSRQGVVSGGCAATHPNLCVVVQLNLR